MKNENDDIIGLDDTETKEVFIPQYLTENGFDYELCSGRKTGFIILWMDLDTLGGEVKFYAKKDLCKKPFSFLNFNPLSQHLDFDIKEYE